MKQIGIAFAFIAIVALGAYLTIEITSREPAEPERVRPTPAARPTATPETPPAAPTATPAGPEGVVRAPSVPTPRPAPGQVNRVLVTDHEGNPIPEARVVVLGPSGPVERTTGEDGKADFHLGTSEPVTLLVSAEGYPRGGVADAVTHPDTVFRIELPPGAPVSGAVRDRISGSPLPGAVVAARPGIANPGNRESSSRKDSGDVDRDGDSPESAENLLDEAWRSAGIPLEVIAGNDGTYEIILDASRLYTLTVSAPRYFPETREGVRPGTANVDFTLRMGGTVFGSVLRSDGWEPAAGARVLVWRPGEQPEPAAVAVTDASGRYTAGPLADGEHRVTAELGAERSAPSPTLGAPVSVSITERTTQVDLLLKTWKKASIAGTVLGMTGDPLEAATVTLRREEEKDVFETQSTGFEGGYVFENLDPGGWILEARARRHAREEKKVDIASGERLAPVDFTLPPGASISGRVLADETPLPGARVTWIDDPSVSAETGPDGFFTLESLRPGTYVLRAEPPHTGRLLTGVLREVVLGTQDVTGVDLVLAPGGGIRGSVRADAGPVSGATLYVAVHGGGVSRSFSGIPPVTTGPGGRYEIAGVPGGASATVIVRAPGYLPSIGEPLSVPGGRWVDAPPAVLGTEGGWITGMVQGFARDPAPGMPVEAVSNSFRRMPGLAAAPDDWMTWRTVSGSDGTFRIGPLPPGQYQAAVPVPLPLQPPVQRVEIEGTEKKHLLFLLGQIRKVRQGVISGTVTRTDGTPLAGIRVSAWSPQLGDLGETATGPGGAFRLDGLPQRIQLYLEAAGTGAPEHRGLAPQRLKMKAPAENVHITLPRNGSIRGTVTGPDGGPVPGLVLRLTLLRQISGYEIAVPEPQVNRTTGEFLYRDLVPGEYQLVASARGLSREVVSPINVESGGPGEPIEIRLQPGATLRGRVVDDETGKPVPGATVLLHEAFGHLVLNPDEPFRTVTDGDGGFRFEGLSPGWVHISVDHPDYALSRNNRIEFTGEGAEPVEIRLTRGVNLSGRVVDPVENPLPGETVALQGHGAMGRIDRTALTGRDGRFEFEHLPEGTYLLRWQDISKQVRIRGYRTPEVVFRATE